MCFNLFQLFLTHSFISLLLKMKIAPKWNFVQHKKRSIKKKIYHDFHSHSVDNSSYVFVIILRIILTFFIDAFLHFSGDNVCGTNSPSIKKAFKSKTHLNRYHEMFHSFVVILCLFISFQFLYFIFLVYKSFVFV